MNKKIILWVLVMFSLVGFASAALTTNNVGWWAFDDADCTAGVCDNLANVGVGDTTESGSIDRDAAYGILDEGYNIDAGTEIADTNYQFVNGASSMSICIWVRMVSGLQRYAVGDGNSGNSAFALSPAQESAGTHPFFRLTTSTGSTYIQDAGLDITDSAWHQMCGVYDGAEMRLYVDTVEEAQTAKTGTVAVSADLLFGDTTGSNRFTGWFDEVGLWARNISELEIAELYNSGAGFNPYSVAPAVETLNLTSTSPVDDGGSDSSTVDFNGLMNASNDFNCTLYINDVKNTSVNGSSGLDVEFNISRELTDGTYNYFFNCSDTINNNSIRSTNVTNFLVDTISPNLVVDYWTQNNLSTTLNVLSGWLNYSDENLYSINITFDGDIMYNITDTSNTEYNYSLAQINASLKGVGVYDLWTKSCDGHTNEKLEKNWKVKTENTELKYEVDDGWIKIIPAKKTSFNNLFTTELTDRFDFNFETKTKQQNLDFYVESSDYINILQHTKYDGHLVIDNLDAWVDFENEQTKDIKLTRINDNKVLVKIKGLKDKNIKFNSVGELNCIERTYKITKMNYTFTYDLVVVETENQDLELLLFKPAGFDTFNVSILNETTLMSLTSVNYTLNQSYSATIPTQLITGLSKISNFTVNFSVNNLAFSQVFYQTINTMTLSNCSDLEHAPAITFYAKNEEDDSDLHNLTFNIEFKVWLGSEDQFSNFSFAFRNQNNYTVCIYPNETSYQVNSIMEYFNEEEDGITFEDRKYYLDNYTLDNSTDTIYLYNIDASKASAVTIRVYDKSTGDTLDGAFVKILRYYPELGGYKLVEIEKTDNTGYTLGKLVLADVFYKFIVEYDREIVLDSSVKKVLSTTMLLPVSLSEDVLYSYRYISDVAQSVTCTNATSTCRFTWSDTNNLVQTAHFDIFRINAYGKTLIYSSSLDSVAGTLTYVITEERAGNSYRAEGWIETNTEFSNYHKEYAVLGQKGADLVNWGGVAILFPILLLVLTISFALGDLGAIGLISGSLITMVGMFILKILPLDIYSVISFILLGIILISRVRQ
jgi:hypothetical protein